MPSNLHTFPLAPYPGRAPELAPRAGMGSWDPYALLAPADRLLPFVLTRPLLATGSAWVDCARLEHADTGVVLLDFVPTGGAAVDLGLPFVHYQDAMAGLEHFVYMGGIIQALSLPCGVPLRLVVNNTCQSPRFTARPDVFTACLQLDWWHPFPLHGVPYGGGFRQRLFVENGALFFATPTTQEETSTDASTGVEQTTFLALTRAATLSVDPLPAYLAEALSLSRAHAHFTADGEAWRITDAKPTPSGADGGRDGFALSLTQTDVVISRACPAPLLTALPFVPGSVRPYRCGDASDTAPDWQTFAYTCAEGSDGNNTGYQNLSQRDNNLYSTTYNNTRTIVSTTPNYAACPLPTVYYSVQAQGITTRNDCDPGYAGSSVYFYIPAGTYTSIVSQADANQQAQDAYDDGKQAYANANGTCSVAGGGGTVEWRPIYGGTGCFNCQMENLNDPTEVRAATPAEAALYYRQYADDGVYVCTACS